MEIQVEKSTNILHTLSVTVEIEKVDKAFKDAYKDVRKNANIPGFRRGKAPIGLLRNKFGMQITEDVERALVQETLYEAIGESKLDPVAMPNVQAGDLAEGKEFKYTAAIEVQPEIKLTQHTGLPFEDIKVEVSKDDVNGELDDLRKKSAQLVPVTDRDVVEDGDTVLLDYEGFLGDKPFDGGKADNATVEMGASGYIPGFAEGIMGSKVPGEIKVEVTFPEDYQAKDLAGQLAVFNMNLKEIKAQELPELDDEFAQDMGEENLKALKAKTEEGIKARRDEEARGARRQQILKALVDANDFEVAPSMISQQADRMVKAAADRVQQMMGGQNFNLGEAELAHLKKDSMKDAEFQVRAGLLLNEVGKAESFEITTKDIDAEIEKITKDSGDHAVRMKAMMNTPQERENMQYRLLEERTIAFLVENADGAAAKPAKKAATKKTAAKKTTTKKATTKKAATKKTTAKKTTAKKTTKKAATKKTAAKSE